MFFKIDVPKNSANFTGGQTTGPKDLTRGRKPYRTLVPLCRTIYLKPLKKRII